MKKEMLVAVQLWLATLFCFPQPAIIIIIIRVLGSRYVLCHAQTKHDSPCNSIYLEATISMPLLIFATSNPFRFNCSTSSAPSGPPQVSIMNLVTATASSMSFSRGLFAFAIRRIFLSRAHSIFPANIVKFWPWYITMSCSTDSRKRSCRLDDRMKFRSSSFNQSVS